MVLAEAAREEMAEVAAPTRATVILCAWRNLLAETAECMMQLRDRGWAYMIKRGDALITRSRSIAVSKWYRTSDDDVFLMIDDDVVFLPEHAERVVELARATRSVACAAYPVKDGTHLACRRFPGQEIVFGEQGGPVEIVYAATGFMAVHREVIDAMIAARTPEDRPHFPLCGEGDGAMWPFFDTFALTGEDGRSEYLSEDYAFSEVARQLGFPIWLDSSVVLYHMGYFPYNVMEMQGVVPVEDRPREPAPITTTDGFRMYLPEGDGVIARDLRVQGAWDIETGNAIREHLQPGWTFLDLGAHIGYFSLLAQRQGARVIAVEPVRANVELLGRNAESNPRPIDRESWAIEMHWCAVGAEPGDAWMATDPRNTGAAHRVQGDENAGEATLVRALPDILHGRWPEFVKLDIEGDEYEVLASYPELLRHARVVLCEVSEHHLRRQTGGRRGAADLLQLLGDAGFTLTKVIGRPGYADWLGVRGEA